MIGRALIASLVMLSMAPSAGANPLDRPERVGNPRLSAQATFAPIIAKALPAVVRVHIRGETLKERPILLANPAIRDLLKQQGQIGTDGVEPFTSTGSGIIIDADKGLIMTNFHVIEDAAEIRVQMTDGREFDAVVVGTDAATDVAALRIAPIRLTAIPLADSLSVQVGDLVFAIGNPLGLDFTATMGMVSSILRSGVGYRTFEGYIQHDAPVNSGNSGGALINLEGQLVGMNTAIRSPSGGSVGLGFAVPSGLAMRIFNQLVKHGKVRRGHVGTKVDDITRTFANTYGLTSMQGAFVLGVQPGSPAEKAGLEFTDVIVAVTIRHPQTGELVRVPVARAGNFETVLAALQIGETLAVEYTRLGQKRSTELQIADMRPEPDRLVIPEGVVRMAGVVLQSLQLTDPAFGEVRGVEVISVPPASIADVVGLRTGDIITSIGKERVRTVGDVLDLTRKQNGRYDVSILRARVPYKLEFPL